MDLIPNDSLEILLLYMISHTSLYESHIYDQSQLIFIESLPYDSNLPVHLSLTYLSVPFVCFCLQMFRFTIDWDFRTNWLTWRNRK